MVRPIKSALLSQLTQPERACFHPHRPSSECLIRFQGCCGPCRQGASPSGTARSASCHPHRALLRARRICRFRLPCKMFPYTSKPLLPDNLYLIQGDSFLQSHPGRFSPSASFLICRPSFAVQQLLASAVWAGACRSYLARQLGVIQPGTPTHQCHVLAPLIAQFCPHQKYSDYLRIILQIQQNPKWFPGIMGATTAQHRQNTKESIIWLTRPKSSQVARISPLLVLAYATPTAVFALISLPPMVAHHLTTTRSTLHQQTVMATWDLRDGLKHHWFNHVESCHHVSEKSRTISDIPDRDTMGLKRHMVIKANYYKYKWKWHRTNMWTSL